MDVKADMWIGSTVGDIFCHVALFAKRKLEYALTKRQFGIAVADFFIVLLLHNSKRFDVV